MIEQLLGIAERNEESAMEGPRKRAPKWLNSRRINMDTTKPSTPENAPKIKYKVPITLWLVEKIQRDIHGFVKIFIINIFENKKYL
jgi:hypothetical protein